MTFSASWNEISRRSKGFSLIIMHDNVISMHNACKLLTVVDEGSRLNSVGIIAESTQHPNGFLSQSPSNRLALIPTFVSSR